MGLPATVSHTGSIMGSPATQTAAFPSLQEIANTSFTRTYGQRQSGAPEVLNATDLSPFILPLGTCNKVQCLFLRVTGGTIKVKVTSALGVDQVLPLSDMILWHSPNSGDELTAIKIVGTGNLEYTVFGNL